MLRSFGMIDARCEAAFGAGDDFAHANGNVEGEDLVELGAGHVDSFGQVVDGFVALARDDTVAEEDGREEARLAKKWGRVGSPGRVGRVGWVGRAALRPTGPTRPTRPEIPQINA